MKRTMLAAIFLLSACNPNAPSEQWSHVGQGNQVFKMPAVKEVRILGAYSCLEEPGYGSNFMVWLGDKRIVNEILGPMSGKHTFDETMTIGGGGVVTISYSTCIRWVFEEVR